MTTQSSQKSKPRTFIKKGDKKQKQGKSTPTSSEFPSIFRFITEWKLFSSKHQEKHAQKEKSHAQVTKSHTYIKRGAIMLLILGVYLMLLIPVVVVGRDVYLLSGIQESRKSERQKVIDEIAYWKEIVTQYPDYRDAYYTVAVLEYKLGNLTESNNYLQKALQIDPNFEKGRLLELELQRE